MKIFVDDIRVAPNHYDLVFRTGEDFINWLKDNSDKHIDLISLDHDLGEGIMDGYELVKQMVDICFSCCVIQFHTDNITGFLNMYHYLKSANKAGVINVPKLRKQKVNCINGVETIAPYNVTGI